jgi:hypothetical protein
MLQSLLAPGVVACAQAGDLGNEHEIPATHHGAVSGDATGDAVEHSSAPTCDHTIPASCPAPSAACGTASGCIATAALTAADEGSGAVQRSAVAASPNAHRLERPVAPESPPPRD